MKSKLPKNIVEKTVSFKEVFSHFTKQYWKEVEEGVRLYDLRQELRGIRKQLKLTQAELAQKASLPRTTITKIESGRYNPTINTLMTIASAMDKKLEIRFV